MNLQLHIELQIDRYFVEVVHAGLNTSFSAFYQRYVMVPSSLHLYNRTRCCVDGCGKPKGNGTAYCWMHKARRHKQINPLSFIWSKLKNDAKRREISFTLTKRYFKLFCWYHDYNVYSGRRDNDYNIDRIRNNRGYGRGNIQILIGKANRDKYHQVDKVEEDNDPLPF